jgi:hypothetical protein
MINLNKYRRKPLWAILRYFPALTGIATDKTHVSLRTKFLAGILTGYVPKDGLRVTIVPTRLVGHSVFGSTRVSSMALVVS